MCAVQVNLFITWHSSSAIFVVSRAEPITLDLQMLSGDSLGSILHDTKSMNTGEYVWFLEKGEDIHS